MTSTGEVDAADDELESLRAIAAEYSVTVRVLAVIVELLLREIGGDVVEIEDATLADAPDLKAWREDDRSAVAITVERGH